MNTAIVPHRRLDLVARRAVRQVEHAPSKRDFSAAQINRLTQSWRSNGLSLDTLLQTDLPVLRARARGLQEGNEYFQKFLSMLKSNVIGDCGMTLKNKACELPTFQDGEIIAGKPDKLANKLTEDAFFEWGKKENCTTAKNLTWIQVQHLAMEEWGTAGETLWRMVKGPAAQNKFNFALQPIAIDRICHTHNHNLANGNTIRMGKEKNAAGRVVAYWLTDGDPTDILYSKTDNYNPKRYDASEFVNPFLMRRIGQTSGFPWAAAAMLRLKMLGDYDEAEIVGSVAASRKMAFLTKAIGTGQDYTGENAAGGGKYMDAEAGMVEELPMGMDVKVVDWNHPNSVYGDFTSACLRGIACGLNVAYPNLANDYASVNFSSGRMARLEEVEFWKYIQACVASDFHEPIFSNWLEMALLSGAIKYQLPSGREIVLPASKREKFDQPYFHGRRWGWLDPAKEVAAKAEELRLGITSRTRILADLGIDRDELFDEIEADREAAEQRGITFPEDAEQQAALAAAAMPVTEAQPTPAE